jgi:hypothetical protein
MARCAMVSAYLHVHKFTQLILQDGVLQALKVAARVETGATTLLLQVGWSANRGRSVGNM